MGKADIKQKGGDDVELCLVLYPDIDWLVSLIAAGGDGGAGLWCADGLGCAAAHTLLKIGMVIRTVWSLCIVTEIEITTQTDEAVFERSLYDSCIYWLLFLAVM